MVISSEVHARDSFGRFIADVEGAATKVVEDAIQAGEDAARAAAPERTGALKAGFFAVVVSRTMGRIGNTTPWADFQDQGTSPHYMIGSPVFRFYWENAGRWWVPGLFGDPDIIFHPGNPAVHFMDTGYAAAVAAARKALPRYYPG